MNTLACRIHAPLDLRPGATGARGPGRHDRRHGRAGVVEPVCD